MNQYDPWLAQNGICNEMTQLSWISGFWSRIIALLIDMIILGLVGYSISCFFEKALVEIGSWGRLIGFFIAFLYFGFMNSEIFNGQTLGKKLLKIKVVDADNRTIHLGKSFYRFMILGTPYFMNGIHFPESVLKFYGDYFLSAIIIGGLVSISYLYIFNRVTRQSLHDLVVNTYVINDGCKNVKLVKIWKPHLALVAMYFIIAILLPAYRPDNISDLANTQQLQQSPYVKNVLVSMGNTKELTTGQAGFSFVNAQFLLKEDQIKNKELVSLLAARLASNYPDSLHKNIAYIELVYGYDIGIFSKWKKIKYSIRPDELNKIVQANSEIKLNQKAIIGEIKNIW